MITHFVGRDEVTAYCFDLKTRLIGLGDKFPKRWFLLGESGKKLGEVLFNTLPDTHKDLVDASIAYVNRSTGNVTFSDQIDADDFSTGPILLLDSAVHSGTTMKRVHRELVRLGAKDVITYSLMLKQSSVVTPTYFGILVPDLDRIYFQLDQMPNNRLSEKMPFGLLRELGDDEQDYPFSHIGPPLGTPSGGSLLYGKITSGQRPYIYDYDGQAIGLVVVAKHGMALHVEAWGTGVEWRHKGIGSAMLRWAETWGRSNDCNRIELWAYMERIPLYKRYGYKEIDGKKLDWGGGHYLQFMRKRLLSTTQDIP